MPAVRYRPGGFPPAELDLQRLLPLVGPADAELARYDGTLSAIPNAGEEKKADIREVLRTGWCAFFLTAVIEQARSNQIRANAILELYQAKKQWIVELTHSQHAVKALDWFFSRPIFKVPDFIVSSGIPKPTANRIIQVARERGLLRVLRPGSGRRPAVLAFPELINIAEGKAVL